LDEIKAYVTTSSDIDVSPQPRPYKGWSSPKILRQEKQGCVASFALRSDSAPRPVWGISARSRNEPRPNREPAIRAGRGWRKGCGLAPAQHSCL